MLLKAAEKVGIERTVHSPVAKATPVSMLPYFRRTGRVKEILRAGGIPYPESTKAMRPWRWNKE